MISQNVTVTSSRLSIISRLPARQHDAGGRLTFHPAVPSLTERRATGPERSGFSFVAAPGSWG